MINISIYVKTIFLALMHATIFGNVASIVGRIYTRRQEYDRKVTGCAVCIRHPDPVFQKVRIRIWSEQAIPDPPLHC